MTAANSRTATLAVAVDWLGDGDYTDANDVVTADVLGEQGLTISRGKDGARSRAKPMVPAGEFSLNNAAKTYSAEFAGSPIYQLILPDRPVQVQATIGADIDFDATDVDFDAADRWFDGLLTTSMITGLTDEPVQMPEIGTRMVRFGMIGSMAALRGRTVSTTLYTNVRTDQCIGYVLDAAGWPAGQRVLAIGETTLNYWWLDGADAWDALMNLVETEGSGSSLYEDGQGRIVFQNRNYRTTAARSISSQGTFRDDGSSDTSIERFRYEAGLRDIYNEVSHVVNRRVAQAVAKVWEYGTSLVLPGGSTTIFARTTTGDPWTNVQAFAVTTDYVVSSGTLLTAVAAVIGATVVSITFVTSGGATLLGPGSAATGPQLRAQALPVVSTERVTQSAASSALLHTTRSLALESAGASKELTVPAAQAIVDAAAVYYRDPRATVTIGFWNVNSDALEQIMLREVSDLVTIVEAQTGVSALFWIEQIRFRFLDSGYVAVEFVCSKALGTFIPALWDSGLWNTGLWAT